MNGPSGKTLVLGGKNGLLGRAITSALTGAGAEVVAVSSADVDYFDFEAMQDLVDAHDPDRLVNTVAYTQVDKAEDEPEEAYRLNAALPGLLGVLAEERGLQLTHFSTDFVFDGTKGAPYLPTDAPNPLSVYGASKLAGERALLELDLPDLLILRTAWLFGPEKMNFVQRILQLAAEREELSVVNDQFGSPTYTPDLAELTLTLLRKDVSGLLHAANSGQASWFELASEAVELAHLPCRVNPIPTSGYPTKAVRPPCSVLDLGETERLAGYTLTHWRDALAVYVADLRSEARD